MRRLVTRLVGLIPSAVVAATVGQQGIDTLLVASQVVLSIVLPFVVFPLVYLTSSGIVMRVVDGEEDTTRYRNGKALTFLGYTIFLVVVVANGYALITLGMGVAP